MRSRLVVLGLAALIVIGAVRWAAAATTFNVTNRGMSAFTIDGIDNATLTLARGQVYTFAVDAPAHPFWITTARGAGDTEGKAFSQGVTGNGESQGTVTFVVPASAPATLFYECSFHDPMGGTLNIVAPAAVPIGPATTAALTGLLLLGAIARLTKRRLGSLSNR